MASSTRPVPGNLPATVTSFVGRRREIAEVRRCLSTSRLVTLLGPGGVGKTRLAIEVAADSRRAFPDGVWLVDLSAVTDEAVVADVLAAGLEVRERSVKPALDAVVEQMTAKCALVVLDNCEHVIDACATVVDRLLRNCPGVRVLAASRHALEIHGEQVFPVPPLGVPDPDQPASVQALRQFESITLLVDRASAVVPGFAMTEQNSAAVARLCAKLDGLPLAIELAAPRLRILSVQQLVDRLSDRFGLLTAGSRTAAARQRTLRALVDWSYDLCSAQEQRMWARISVFSGGFDLAAAERVCAGDGVRREDVPQLLDNLVTRSVVVTTPSETRQRFRMLETLREYGLARLAEFREQSTLRRRHRDYYLRIARRCVGRWCGPEQEDLLAGLRADHGNLRAAFEWSLLEPGGVRRALRLCAGLGWHWCANGFLSEGRRWLDEALDATAPADAARVEALWVAGWVSFLQGDARAARGRLVECRELATRLNDPLAAAQVENLTASALLVSGGARAAVEGFIRAAVALDSLGATWPALMAQFQLGASLLLAGDLDAASRTLRATVDRCVDRGERLIRSYALWTLARVLLASGDPQAARQNAQAALRLQRGFRDSVGVAAIIEVLAVVAGLTGDHARAAALLGAARSVWRSAGTDVSTFGAAGIDPHAECERAARHRLGERAFRAAFADGAQPSVEHAIEFALNVPRAQRPGPASTVLTRREREVAELIGQGLSNRQIAERLVLSTRTVDGHVENILARLGFGSRAQVAAWVATAEPR